jgi:signal transduction histidine kinase
MDFCKRWRWEIGWVIAIAVIGGILMVSETGQDQITKNRHLITAAEEQTTRLTQLMNYVADAESGQRGYLLTQRESYLKPYYDRVEPTKKLLERIAIEYDKADDVEGSRRVSELTALIGARLSVLDMVLKLAQQDQMDRAMEIFHSDIGRNKMVEIRDAMRTLIEYNNQRAQELRQGAVDISNNWRLLVAAATSLNIILVTLLFLRLGKAWRARERQAENLKMQQDYLDGLVDERTRQLEALSVHLQEVLEAEKLRLARELHDELGSILTAAKMDVSWVRRRLGRDSEDLSSKLERTLKNIDQGITVKRRLIEDLRPSTLTSFGLVVAARELAEETASRNEWQLQIELPEAEPDLQEDTATALYRILQESLTNATKYAMARSVDIRLLCENDELRLDIMDDGVGFTVSDIRPKAHGLLGMKQRVQARGGTFEIRSRPGEGCHVSVVLPLRRKEQCEAAPDGECKTETIEVS